MLPAIAAMAIRSLLATGALRGGMYKVNQVLANSGAADTSQDVIPVDRPETRSNRYMRPLIEGFQKADRTLFQPMDQAGDLDNDAIVAQMERVPVLKMARARLQSKHQGELDAVRAIGGVVPLGGERYARYRDQLANR